MVLPAFIAGCQHIIQYNRGVRYGRAGNYEGAIESFKKAISIKPDFATGHFGLGLSYCKAGDKKSALKQYKILETLNEGLANQLLECINK